VIDQTLLRKIMNTTIDDIKQALIDDIKEKRDEMKDIHKNYGEEEFARGYIVALDDMINLVEVSK
jgi:hypothetical protein